MRFYLKEQLKEEIEWFDIFRITASHCFLFGSRDGLHLVDTRPF